MLAAYPRLSAFVHQNIGGNSPGSLSPHHREGSTAPHGDNDGANGTGISFEMLMAAIDLEHHSDLSGEQQGHQQHRQKQEQEQKGEEGGGEAGVHTSAAAAAAVPAIADPVEPTKAILEGAAVAEAVERAMAATLETTTETKDAMSILITMVAHNQVRKNTYDCSKHFLDILYSGVPGGLVQQRCQETCQARKNMRCQGCTAECSTLKPSSVVSVKACQGKNCCLSRGENAVS